MSRGQSPSARVAAPVCRRGPRSDCVRAGESARRGNCRNAGFACSMRRLLRQVPSSTTSRCGATSRRGAGVFRPGKASTQRRTSPWSSVEQRPGSKTSPTTTRQRARLSRSRRALPLASRASSGCCSTSTSTSLRTGVTSAHTHVREGRAQRGATRAACEGSGHVGHRKRGPRPCCVERNATPYRSSPMYDAHDQTAHGQDKLVRADQGHQVRDVHHAQGRRATCTRGR